MRVLYDAYWWRCGPVSGRVVMRELLRAWVEAYPQDELVLAVRPGDEAVVREATGSRHELARVRGRPHGVATLLQYPVLARKYDVDVAFTQNFAPPGVPTATFIHDVMYQTNPEWFTAPERAYFWLIPRFARGARLVVTSSQHEAARIERCNPRLRRVRAVGLAVATALTDADPRRPTRLPEGVPFLLTVGRLNVRKNLGTCLLGALRSGRASPECPVVVVGGPDGRGVTMPAEVTAAAAAGTVIFLESVSDAELAWLYANAQLFVYVSLDEGFGLPPLEARTFGCPVVASDIDVFREVLGDDAVFVDPEDVDTVAAGIAQAPQRNDHGGNGAARPVPAPPEWGECVRRLRTAMTESLA